MEKLVYLLKNGSQSPSTRAERADDVFRDRLLARLPQALHEQGASRLKISVTDSAVDAGKQLHLGRFRPEAFVSFWLECVGDRAGCETILSECSPHLVGYLVVESQPLRTETPAGGAGRRMPGFSLVGCIEPAPGLSHPEFIDRWESSHRQVAIETQSTFSYVRNEIVRPLTPEAPAWGGIVEEGFPIEALNDPRVFYDARDSEERFKANSKRMIESCLSFLSLENVDSHPMSEYRFDSGW